jgi:predicted Zn-dependent protease
MRLILLLLSLSACGKTKISVATTDKSLAPILVDVAKAINQAMPAPVILSSEDAEVDVTVSVDDDAVQFHGNHVLAWYDGVNSISLRSFDALHEGNKMSVILVHEFGHAMGLGHTDGTVMDAMYNPYMPLDAATRSLAMLLTE